MTEAFSKYTNTDPKSAKGSTLLAMHFITQATPDIQRKLQKLEAGPQTPSSTLVEEAFKVYNNRDLTEEANKDKRLIKKTQLWAALIHPPPRADPGGPRKLDRPLRSCLGSNQCAFCQKRGCWKGECPEHAPVGRPRGNPNWTQFLENLSDERYPHTD